MTNPIDLKPITALYLRSSKDRNDIAPETQRHELLEYAQSRGWRVVAEYRDVVESAKSEHRPGFQQLIRDLKAADRPWQRILMIDTARLARRTEIAHVFKYEARKLGVDVVFAKLPDTDPITKVILESTFTAMDEVHSLMSREKGLAGMAHNIRAGWRAGGRAPRGYRLKHIETGAMRDGHAVTKSTLEPNEEAPLVTRYLTARAAGQARRPLARELGITWSPSSLIGMEWNALTYAGHSVWNQHSERLPSGGYKGGIKHRPREEWIIQHDTHPALISTEQAEQLLDRLFNSDVRKSISAAKTAGSNYLLTGLLETPDGTRWKGSRSRGNTYYRTQKTKGGRYVPVDAVDVPVLEQLRSDLQSQAFIKALTKAARAQASPADNGITELQADLAQINRRISKAMDMALDLEDPAPAHRKIDELEQKRKAIAAEIQRREQETAAQRTLSDVTEDEVRKFLETQLRGLAGDRARLKPLLAALAERVVLDPQSLNCQIQYRLAVRSSLLVASPRGHDAWAAIRLTVQLRAAIGL